MPKRKGFIYDKMLDDTAIEAAIRKASKGKLKRRDVIKAMKDVPDTVAKIKAMLENDSYVPTIPRVKVRKDPSSGKERVIKVVPFFPDGIMQQLAKDAMDDVLMRSMDCWSCASIPGRGNMRAIKYTKRIMRKDPKHTKYCAKLDIHHYYASIDVDELMRMFRRKIKDERFLCFIEAIFRSDPDLEYVLEHLSDPNSMDEKSVEVIKDAFKDNPQGGLSIGYYINQWAANFYLQGLDRFIRNLDGVYYFVQNMDDMVLYGSNKRKLHRAVDAIDGYLSMGMNLELKDNWQVFPVESRSVDFVGYRFYHDHTILRKRNFLRFTRTCRKVQKKIRNGKEISVHLAASLMARAGQLKHCDSQCALEKYFYPIKIKRIKDIIRRESRARQALTETGVA